MKKITYFLAAFFASQTISFSVYGTHSPNLYGNWPSNNGSSANLDVITDDDNTLSKQNINNLVEYWLGNRDTLINVPPTPPSNPNDPRNHIAVQSTPVIATDSQGNPVVYYATSGGKLYAYHEDLQQSRKPPPNGNLEWSVQLYDDVGNPDYFDESPIITNDLIFIGGRRMHAVDRNTGKEKWATVFDSNIASHFGSIGDIEPSQLMVTPGTSSHPNGLVVYGIGYSGEIVTPQSIFDYYNNAIGEIIAFDQVSGQVVWRVTPDTADGTMNGAYPSNRTANFYGPGGGTFGGAGIDAKRHLLFIGTNNNYATINLNSDGLPLAGPLTDSLLAIDYTTGQVKWSYQYQANDVCGYDIYRTQQQYCPSNAHTDLDVDGHPQVFTINVNNVPTDVVGSRGKDGTYRLFARNQSSSTATPIAQIQLDGAAGFNLSIGADPVIVNGNMYIASGAFLDPNYPGISYSIDFDPSGDPAQQTTHLRSINLQKWINWTTSYNTSNQITCVGTISEFYPSPVSSRCSGSLPSNIINWETDIFPSQVESSSGLTYDNGMIMLADFNGHIQFYDSGNGHKLASYTFTDPNFTNFYNYFGISNFDGGVITGGVVVDNGIVFVPFGIDFQGYNYPFGGVVAYTLPQQ